MAEQTDKPTSCNDEEALGQRSKKKTNLEQRGSQKAWNSAVCNGAQNSSGRLGQRTTEQIQKDDFHQQVSAAVFRTDTSGPVSEHDEPREADSSRHPKVKAVSR